MIPEPHGTISPSSAVSARPSSRCAVAAPDELDELDELELLAGVLVGLAVESVGPSAQLAFANNKAMTHCHRTRQRLALARTAQAVSRARTLLCQHERASEAGCHLRRCDPAIGIGIERQEDGQ